MFEKKFLLKRYVILIYLYFYIYISAFSVIVLQQAVNLPLALKIVAYYVTKEPANLNPFQN